MRSKLSIVLACLFLCSFQTFPQEPVPSEKIILDDLLKEINNTGINNTVKILTRVNKFFLIPRDTKEKPFTPSPEQKKQGFVLFSRNSLKPVFHNSSPGKRQVGRLPPRRCRAGSPPAVTALSSYPDTG